MDTLSTATARASDDAIRAREIARTQSRFVFYTVAEYFLAGAFWVVATVGALYLKENPTASPGATLFRSLAILMLSNAVWEILTGWYADKWRRRVAMASGFFFYAAGYSLLVVAAGRRSEFMWSIAITVWSLGPALLSGSREAWLFDRCKYFSRSPVALNHTYTTAATLGVLLKAVGAALTLLAFHAAGIFDATGNQIRATTEELLRAVGSCAVPASLAAFLLMFRTGRAPEEYWANPKYQTHENLTAFVAAATRILWKPPFCWFALSFAGATMFNYLLSSTLWPYLIASSRGQDAVHNQLLIYVAVAVGTDVLASLASLSLKKWAPVLASSPLALPSVALLSATPLALQFLHVQYIEYAIIAYTVAVYRIVQGPLLGTLIALGQSANGWDQYRAVLLSMASASAAVLFALPCIWLGVAVAEDSTLTTIHWAWLATVPLGALLLSSGFLLVPSRGRRAA